MKVKLILSILIFSILTIQIALAATDREKTIGDVNAPVTIEMYTDFEDSFSARWYADTFPTIKLIFIDEGDANLIIKHFPLDFDTNAFSAAVAAECAAEQGLYLEYVSLLYQTEDLTINDLFEFADDVNAKSDEFDDCYEGDDAATSVQFDKDEGVDRGITGTPTFYIHGIEIIGAQPYEVFEEAILQALSEVDDVIIPDKGFINKILDFAALISDIVELFQSVEEGDVIEFEILGEIHSITIDEINVDSIKITIRSEPLTYVIGLFESIIVDIDQNGVGDLGITLDSINNGLANLDFFNPTGNEKITRPFDPTDIPDDGSSTAAEIIAFLIVGLLFVGVSYGGYRGVKYVRKSTKKDKKTEKAKTEKTVKKENPRISFLIFLIISIMVITYNIGTQYVGNITISLIFVAITFSIYLLVILGINIYKKKVKVEDVKFKLAKYILFSLTSFFIFYIFISQGEDSAFLTAFSIAFVYTIYELVRYLIKFFKKQEKSKIKILSYILALYIIGWIFYDASTNAVGFGYRTTFIVLFLYSTFKLRDYIKNVKDKTKLNWALYISAPVVFLFWIALHSGSDGLGLTVTWLIIAGIGYGAYWIVKKVRKVLSKAESGEDDTTEEKEDSDEKDDDEPEEKEEVVAKSDKKLPFDKNVKVAISVANFTLKYKQKTILENINFEIEKGEMVCLLGPSGTGKSTVIESLVGRKNPTKGTLKLLGENISKNKKIYDYIGFVPQHAELYMNQTVMQNLVSSGIKWGIKDSKARAEKILSKINLSERKDLNAGKLSGGQQKLLSLGMELLRDIEVCILDEPTTGLDPTTRNNIITILSNITTQLHKTIFFTTHFMDDAEECDRVIILAGKKIVADGPPAKLERMLPGGGKIVNIILDNVTDDLLAKIEKIEGIKKLVREGRNLRIISDTPNAIKLGQKIDEVGGVVNETKIEKATMMDVFVYNTGKKPEDQNV